MPLRTKNGNLPQTFYAIAIGLFAWAMVMAWIGFAGTEKSIVNLVAVTLGLAVFFGIPVALALIRNFTARRHRVRRDDGKVETETGPVNPGTAEVEMLIPVISVAVGFTVLAIVFLLI